MVGKDGRVTGLECVKTELGEPDASGRRRPVPVAGSEFVVAADMVIAAIGEVPDLAFLGTSGVAVEKGTITVDPRTMATNVKGIFAGGDAVSGPATVIEAIAAGTKAALPLTASARAGYGRRGC